MTRPKTLYWATESRLERGSDGFIRSPHPGDAYENYAPMLQHFDEVVVVARVSEVSSSLNARVEGARVRVCPLPDYAGALQAAKMFRRVSRTIASHADDSQGYFAGKVPGLITLRMVAIARRHTRPLLLNVVGDPEDVLKTGTLGSFASIGAPIVKLVLQRLVRSADAVVYVSECYLQKKYPVRPGAEQLSRSNVRLDSDSFAQHDFRPGGSGKLRVISVGSHDQLYKGHDLLIDAIPGLRARGVDVELHLVGAGRRQTELRQLVHRRKLGDVVIFHGHVGNVLELRVLLDQSDVYVQPSRTEGVPRALIEAMARQLPCLGSSAGGIPELLDDHAIFAVDDLDGLTNRLEEFRSSPDQMESRGLRNQARAREVGRHADASRYADFFGKFSQLAVDDSAEL